MVVVVGRGGGLVGGWWGGDRPNAMQCNAVFL